MRHTSEMSLEGTVGGSFIDDLLGEIGFPDNVFWWEDHTHVEARVDGAVYRRSKKFLDGQGQYAEEWKKITP